MESLAADEAGRMPSEEALRIAKMSEPRVGNIVVTALCPPELRDRDVWSIDQFVLAKKLGGGYASTVYLAIDRATGLQLAVKSYHRHKLSALNHYQVRREVRIHAALDHPHVLPLYAAFEDLSCVYLASEYAPRGDVFGELDRRGGSLPERDAVRSVVAPFLSALQYLHARGVVHRDIKPENLLFTAAGVLKVADFGLSIDMARELPVTRVGTLDYMAPEVVVCPDKPTAPVPPLPLPLAAAAAAPSSDGSSDASAATADAPLVQPLASSSFLPTTLQPGAVPSSRLQTPPGARYGPPVDAWAVGVLAYELTVGRAPFDGGSKRATIDRILRGSPAFPAWVSEPARHFVLWALTREAARRPTVADLAQHPWLAAHAEPGALERGRADAAAAAGRAIPSLGACLDAEGALVGAAAGDGSIAEGDEDDEEAGAALGSLPPSSVGAAAAAPPRPRGPMHLRSGSAVDLLRFGMGPSAAPNRIKFPLLGGAASLSSQLSMDEDAIAAAAAGAGAGAGASGASGSAAATAPRSPTLAAGPAAGAAAAARDGSSPSSSCAASGGDSGAMLDFSTAPGPAAAAAASPFAAPAAQPNSAAAADAAAAAEEAEAAAAADRLRVLMARASSVSNLENMRAHALRQQQQHQHQAAQQQQWSPRRRLQRAPSCQLLAPRPVLRPEPSHSCFEPGGRLHVPRSPSPTTQVAAPASAPVAAAPAAVAAPAAAPAQHQPPPLQQMGSAPSALRPHALPPASASSPTRPAQMPRSDSCRSLDQNAPHHGGSGFVKAKSGAGLGLLPMMGGGFLGGGTAPPLPSSRGLVAQQQQQQHYQQPPISPAGSAASLLQLSGPRTPREPAGSAASLATAYSGGSSVAAAAAAAAAAHHAAGPVAPGAAAAAAGGVEHDSPSSMSPTCSAERPAAAAANANANAAAARGQQPPQQQQPHPMLQHAHNRHHRTSSMSLSTMPALQEEEQGASAHACPAAAAGAAEAAAGPSSRAGAAAFDSWLLSSSKAAVVSAPAPRACSHLEITAIAASAAPEVVGGATRDASPPTAGGVAVPAAVAAGRGACSFEQHQQQQQQHAQPPASCLPLFRPT